MPYKPNITFDGSAGERSIGLDGPDSIKRDLTELNKMFDPLATHDDETSSPGGIGPENMRAGGVDDNAIGDLTPNDSYSTAFTGTGKLSIVLSFISKMIKAITGKSNWYTLPDDNLTTLKSDITNLEGVGRTTETVKANADSIATNTSNIAINTTNISTNSGNIDSYATEIANNEADIENKFSSLAGVGRTTENVKKNADDIASLTSTVNTNETDIENKVSNLSGTGRTTETVKANADNIATNTSNISTNTTNISTNASNIEANETDIENKFSSLAGTDRTTENVKQNADDIAANASNIATNQANIAANATAISDNETDIENKVSNLAGTGRTTETVKTNADNLTTHKSSADHDGRYYTETEIDSFLNALKGLGYSDETLSDLQSQIDNLNNIYSTDQERIQAINDVIAQYEAADSDLQALINNKAEITALENLAGVGRTTETVKGNADDIASLTSTVNANETDIENKVSDLAGVGRTDETVKGNADNIATNTSNISTNTSNIATNTSNIATNESNISANATAISNNETDIENKFTSLAGTGRTTENVKANADNLTTHKTSADHDSRYYTETEIDNKLASKADSVTLDDYLLKTQLATTTEDGAMSALDKSKLDSLTESATMDYEIMYNELQTHKTSADHDSRYYTETEIDSKLLPLNTHKDNSTIHVTKDGTVQTNLNADMVDGLNAYDLNPKDTQTLIINSLTADILYKIADIEVFNNGFENSVSIKITNITAGVSILFTFKLVRTTSSYSHYSVIDFIPHTDLDTDGKRQYFPGVNFYKKDTVSSSSDKGCIVILQRTYGGYTTSDFEIEVTVDETNNPSPITPIAPTIFDDTGYTRIGASTEWTHYGEYYITDLGTGGIAFAPTISSTGDPIVDVVDQFWMCSFLRFNETDGSVKVPDDPSAVEDPAATWSDISNNLITKAQIEAKLTGDISSHNHDTAYEPKNANIQTHISSPHAPSDAQKNSDILQSEIEAKLIGTISTHDHAADHTHSNKTTLDKITATGTEISFDLSNIGTLKKDGDGYSIDNGSTRPTLGFGAIDLSYTADNTKGAKGQNSAIFGGQNNEVVNDYGVIGGGNSNYVGQEYGVVLGGAYNSNNGYMSSIIGNYCSTNASYSHAQNLGTIAQGKSQTAIGEYNIAQGTWQRLDAEHAFIIGNGTSTTSRSNALTVDWNGNLVASGDVTDGSGNTLSDISNKSDKNIEINTQTVTAYTLVLTDASRLVDCDNTGATVLTVPTNSVCAFPIGTQILVRQKGVGQVSIVGDAGVVVNSAEGSNLTNVQYSVAGLIKIDTDTWALFGDVVAV